MTVTEFRAEVARDYPHVQIRIRRVDFTDLARGSGRCLTVTGDRPGEIDRINELARRAGILPDGNVRFRP